MFVGFIIIYAIRDPDNFLCSQHVAELVCDLCFGHLGVTAFAKKTALCNYNCSFAVRMDSASFKDEILSIIYICIKSLTYLRCCRVIILIIRIQTVYIAAPGIELPVDTSYTASFVSNKSWPHVSCPAVISRDHKDMYVRGAFFERCIRYCLSILYIDDICIKRFGSILGMLLICQHIHYFMLGNLFCDLSEDFLSFYPSIGPGTGSYRPDHYCSNMLFEFARHMETVSLGRCN